MDYEIYKILYLLSLLCKKEKCIWKIFVKYTQIRLSNTNTNITSFGFSNTNTNTNTDICVFKYKYKYKNVFDPSPAEHVQLCKQSDRMCVNINTSRPRQKMAAVSQTTFSNAFSWMKMFISIKISPKFVPKGPINNIPALVQIMVWCRLGNKPLSEPMTVGLPTHASLGLRFRLNIGFTQVKLASSSGHTLKIG